MRTIGIIICSIFISSFLQADNEIEVKSNIQEAKIFMRGAQVKSEGASSIPAGTSKLIFSNLSSSINKSTIQAKGEGNFTILGVTHEFDYNREAPKPKRLLVLEDSLKLIQKEIKIQQGLINVYSNEESMLLANKNITGENTGVTALELEKVASLFRTKLSELSRKRIETDITVTELRNDEQRISRQMNEVQREHNKSTSKIIVEVRAKATTMAKLSISYLVNNAGWTPSYDIKATDTKSPISLHFKGSVYQRSGFDWKNIKISLSTGNPNLSGNKPELNPWWLRFYDPYKKSKSAGYNYGATERLDELEIVAEEDMGMTKSRTMAPSSVAKSVSSYVKEEEMVVNKEYIIGIPYSIPTDGKQHVVDIQKIELPAIYSYYCAPKLDNGVFLLAKIIDWEKYNLLSGNANIFFEDTYVGASHLNTLSTNDTLDISLGRDEAIVVKRTKLYDFSEKKIIGVNVKETSNYEISIKSKKKENIKLVIEDQVPLSSNNNISVEVLETAKARHNKDTGLLTWEIDLASGQNESLKFGYQVKYPKDKVIKNL